MAGSRLQRVVDLSRTPCKPGSSVDRPTSPASFGNGHKDGGYVFYVNAACDGRSILKSRAVFPID